MLCASRYATAPLAYNLDVEVAAERKLPSALYGCNGHAVITNGTTPTECECAMGWEGTSCATAVPSLGSAESVVVGVLQVCVGPCDVMWYGVM